MLDTDRQYGIFMGPDKYANIVERETVIEGVCDVGDNFIINSTAGSGKSILALQLICCLTIGLPFLETFNIPKKRRVLYVQTEGDRAETISRINRMKNALPINDDAWVHYNAIGIPLNTPEGLGRFINTVQAAAFQADVVLIDPLYPTIKGSISDDAVATDWQRGVRIIRERLGNMTFIIFHHDSNKIMYQNGKKVDRAPDNLMGSSFWTAWMSGNYQMSVDPATGVRHLVAGKGAGYGRTGQGVPEINMRLMEPDPLYYVMDDTNFNETEAIVYGKLTSSLGEVFTRRQLEEYIGKSKATVCRALASLHREHKITKVTEQGVIYYTAKTPIVKEEYQHATI